MMTDKKTKTPLQDGLSLTPLVSLPSLELPSMSLRQPVIIPSLTRIQAETILDSPESSDNSVITNIAGIIQREDATFLSFASPKREIKSKETPEGLSSLALNLYNSFNLPDIKVENVKRQSSEEVLRSEKKTIKSTQESFRKNYTKSEAVIQQDQAQKKCQLREAFFELIENIILSDDTEAFTDDNSKLWFPFDRSGTRSLADSVLIHLESLLSRLEYVEKVSEEENDSIIRLLRILNRALGEGTSKYFQEYVDESSIQYIDNSLKTCSVILLIFQNFPTIHGEELLLNIVGFISLLLDNLILPSMAGSDTVLKLDTSKILLRGIQQRITTLLEHVHTFLQHMEPGESAITRLEFMCSKLVFAESTNIILHPISIESMRVIAMKLLTGIFGRYKSQQQFILDEVLLSIEKLPLTRLKARQFKLKQGTNIQLTTALLLLLVESSAEVPIEKITENPSDRIGVMIASLETVTSHCNYIVNFLLEKASKSTKTGEDPHRLLLELFIEDFLNVLFLPEWSAAELIITCFIARFITILESEQSILNSQILALENLGLIIRRLLPIARHRSKVTNDMSTLSDSEFNEWVTSFNQVYYYLFSSGSEMDQLSGNYLLCSYSSVLSLLKKSNYFENIINRELGRNQSERNGDGRNENIAYFELLLYKPISRYYERVLRIILDSLDHSKVNLRSKALKLVSSLLDEDEEIFSVNSVQTSLSNGLIDSSPLVRDSAVEILGKYLIKHPQRDKELYLVLCERSNDTGIAVRKRVVKLFKEIFCTVQKDEVKIVIFDKLLRRMDDEEEIVGDLALQSLTELIFKIDTTTTNLEGQKLRRKDSIYLCNLLYQIYRKSEGQANLLKKFFSKVLNPLSKCFDKTKTEVAEQIVGVIRDVLTEELSTIESEKILCVLSLFATANGSLIDSSLVKFLEAFLIDDKRPISSLLGYYTLVTLRCHLETTVPTSKQRVQSLLLTQLTKFNLKELPEAVQCLWAVSKNSTKKIAVALLSCLKLLSPYEKQARAVGIKQLDQKFVRLIHLIGNLSRFCSLDDDWEIFQKHGVKSHDVSGLVIHKLIPFCSSLQSSSIKKLVLRNIGNICIGHPRHFLTEEVLKLLSNAIKSDNEVEIVLKIVLDHLNNEEFNANQLALFEERKESLDVGILHGITKKQESDGASSAIVQNILDSVLQISLQKEDSLALLATYLLEKILTQGYANPRVKANKCISTIVSLEGAGRIEIAKIAKDTHSKLYAKHGTLLENSYVDAIKQATKYRKSQSNDFTKETDQLVSLYSIIRGSKLSRRKFLSQLMKSIDFDFGVIPLPELKEHLDYIIFLFSGLGGIQFVSIEEVHLIVYGADKLLFGTGSTVMSYIENGEKNELLGIASFILCVAWGAREYLKAAYSLSESRCRDFTPNLPVKETKALPKHEGNFLIESLDLNYSQNDLEIWWKRCEKFTAIMNEETVKIEVNKEDMIEPDSKRLRMG